MIRENEKCLETFKANRGILITCTWCNNYYYVCFRFCKYHIIHNVIRCELEYLFDFKLIAKCNPNSKASITNEIVIFFDCLVDLKRIFFSFLFLLFTELPDKYKCPHRVDLLAEFEAMRCIVLWLPDLHTNETKFFCNEEYIKQISFQM